MWYEALPPLVLIGCFMYSYQIGSSLIGKVLIGNPFRRESDTIWQRVMIERDVRISGTPFNPKGLENIPDD